MALIDCPECRAEISDKAPQCPRCGVPIAGSQATTIQQTGKRLKRRWLKGIGVLACGVVLFFVAAVQKNHPLALVGVFIGLAGFGIALVTEFMAWWHHA